MPTTSTLFLPLLLLGLAVADTDDTLPPYVKQCRANDPKLDQCVIEAVVHLKPYLAEGIAEIAMPSVEPFRTDELALSLSSGPNGYKIVLRDLEIYGASNFTVNSLKLGTQKRPFEATLRIPQLRIAARYTSSGVLIILPASGNGNFAANFRDVTARVKGLGVRERGLQGEEHEEYLQIHDLDVALEIQKVDMSVRKFFNNNRILTEATNLFLRENGAEVLRHMMPQLRRKISSLFSDVANQLLANVPLRIFLSQ
ncbi:hypothetical protein B566_EDAN003951 [Ephemera danica]|nr:hypothetical protein B566_EDAN003951 [Ephemera danica]